MTLQCLKPFGTGSTSFGCGQCLPCRINARRVWTARLILESKLHHEQLFITLTYDQENLPPGEILVKRDYQLFLKRVRRAIQPQRISYYLAGEYGDRSGRPHFHAVLFGLGAVPGHYAGKKPIRDETARMLYSAWGNGSIHIATVNEATLAYACKHVSKTGRLDRQDERPPEFHSMSTRPAIGARAMDDYAQWFSTKGGAKYLAENGDVPLQFRHDGQFYSIGRYLAGKMRESLGYDPKAPDQTMLDASQRFNENRDKFGDEGMASQRRQSAAKARHTFSRQRSQVKL